MGKWQDFSWNLTDESSRGKMKMKWKKYYRESVNDAAEALDASEEPVKIIKVFDVGPI